MISLSIPPRRIKFVGVAAAAALLVGLTGAYNPGEPEPRPNILGNPSMEIDQANEGSSVPLASGADKFIVDRWSAGFHSTTATVSAQRTNDAPAGFANSLKLTIGTGATVAAADYLFIRQPIEAGELTGLRLGIGSAQRACLSFWVKSSIGPYTLSAVLQNYAGTRSYPIPLTVASGNTWTPLSACFALDTGGAWVTTGTAGGAYLMVTAAAGSTFQGTAGAWSSANLYGTSANSNTILATSGATFQLTGVKLEASPTPTPFARRPVGQEIGLAQRFYEKTFAVGTRPAQAAGGVGAINIKCPSTNAFAVFWQFAVPKRATPAVTLFSPGTTNNNWWDYSTGTSLTAVVDPQSLVGANGIDIAAGVVCPNANDVVAIHAVADARLNP